MVESEKHEIIQRCKELKAVRDLRKSLRKRLRKWRIEKIENFLFFMQTRPLHMQLRISSFSSIDREIYGLLDTDVIYTYTHRYLCSQVRNPPSRK